MSRCRYPHAHMCSLTLKMTCLGRENDKTLSKLLLNSHVGGFHLANMPRIMRNFAPRFRNTAPQETTFSLTLCLYTLTSNKNTSSLCASIVTADRMLPRSAQISSRPTEYPMRRDGILSRPTKYAMLWNGILYRATEYNIQLRKYSNGRQSTSAICERTTTAERVCDAIGWRTTTADKVRDAIGWNTTTAVRVLDTMEDVL